MIIKTITNHLFILVSVILVFGGQTYLFAAEETTSIMCDEGVVHIGDRDVDVRSKCGKPKGGDTNEWQYDFGPGQPSYTVIFDEGKVVRILESD